MTGITAMMPGGCIWRPDDVGGSWREARESLHQPRGCGNIVLWKPAPPPLFLSPALAAASRSGMARLFRLFQLFQLFQTGCRENWNSGLADGGMRLEA